MNKVIHPHTKNVLMHTMKTALELQVRLKNVFANVEVEYIQAKAQLDEVTSSVDGLEADLLTLGVDVNTKEP